MIRVVHVIQEMGSGGAARAMLFAAKAIGEHGAYLHRILSLSPSSAAGRKLAAEAGIELSDADDAGHAHALIAEADVVQLQWWNTPQMDNFLRSGLPACRLAAWCHVGGQAAPHVIPRALVEFLDVAVACSPYTYRSPAFQELPPGERFRKSAMIYGATDFDRLAGMSKKPRSTFNVGYLGTVDFLKMHPDYVAMSASIDVAEARFVVYGAGRAEAALRAQAAASGCAHKFELRGHVEDVRSAIETFDVYGYPLCPDTYAASEMNLQEVMYAGIPPIVFPYGGVKDLVIDNFTGYVVSSARAYKEAIEFLYHHPEERERLGRNAREYAVAMFDIRKTGLAFHQLYARMLRAPKRERAWPRPRPASGAHALLESLDGALPELRSSLEGGSIEEVMEAEAALAGCPEVVRVNGIEAYRNHYQMDPYLRLWNGLALAGLGAHAAAAGELIGAVQLGLNHWRLFLYIARSARALGDEQAVKTAVSKVLEVEPGCREALAFLSPS